MNTSTPQTPRARKGRGTAWRRHLVVAALLLAGVASAVGVFTWFATQAAEAHQQLEINLQHVVEKKGDDLHTLHQSMVKRLKEYDINVKLQIWLMTGAFGLTWLGWLIMCIGGWVDRARQPGVVEPETAEYASLVAIAPSPSAPDGPAPVL